MHVHDFERYYFFQNRIKKSRVWSFRNNFTVLADRIEDLSISKLKTISGARNVDGYESMSSEQLKNILTKLFAPQLHLNMLLIPRQDLKNLHLF